MRKSVPKQNVWLLERSTTVRTLEFPFFIVDVIVNLEVSCEENNGHEAKCILKANHVYF